MLNLVNDRFTEGYHTADRTVARQLIAKLA
jgi:hypothetical protein